MNSGAGCLAEGSPPQPSDGTKRVQKYELTALTQVTVVDNRVPECGKRHVIEFVSLEMFAVMSEFI